MGSYFKTECRISTYRESYSAVIQMKNFQERMAKNSIQYQKNRLSKRLNSILVLGGTARLNYKSLAIFVFAKDSICIKY